MKTVNDVLAHTGATEVWWVSPDATVYDAIRIMSERQVGALPVIQNRALVGIISERDYARKVILKDKSSKTTRVSEIMTADVITVTGAHRMEDCVALMKLNHIRHLVVVERARVVGMVSLRDLFTEIIDEQAETIDQLEHYIRGQ